MAKGSAMFMWHSTKNVLKSMIRAGPSYSVVLLNHHADQGLFEVGEGLKKGVVLQAVPGVLQGPNVFFCPLPGFVSAVHNTT